MKRNQILLLIAVVVILVVAGVVYFNRPPKPSTTKEITIAQFGDFFLYLPLYVAQDKGYFAEQGLKVNIISTGGDEKTWAAVLSGNAQFGIADPTFVAIAAERGQPGKVVASVVNGVPFWGVTNKPNITSITDPKALKGLSVATFPSPSTAYALQANMFKQAGLQPNIRQGAPGTLLTLLESGQVDIALELEPNVSTAVSRGAHVIYSFPQIYGDFAITGLTTSDDYVKNNSDVVQRVVNAIQKAENFIHSDPSGALEIAAKRFPEVSRDIANQALNRANQEGIIPKSTVISADAWKKAIQLRIEVGDLKNASDMSSYVNNTFAERAASNK